MGFTLSWLEEEFYDEIMEREDQQRCARLRVGKTVRDVDKLTRKEKKEERKNRIAERRQRRERERLFGEY